MLEPLVDVAIDVGEIEVQVVYRRALVRWVLALVLLLFGGCRRGGAVACAEGMSWDEKTSSCAGDAAFAAYPHFPGGGETTVVARCSAQENNKASYAVMVPANLAKLGAHSLVTQKLENVDGGVWPILHLEPTPLAEVPAPLWRYPPRECTPEAKFVLPSGDWLLVVRAPGLHIYAQNRSIAKSILLRPGETIELTYSDADLKPEPSSCCHCPFVSIFDPTKGRDLPAFEVLGGKSSKQLAGVERTPIQLPVRAGRAVLHIRELEDEVTYLSSVSLEVGTAKLAPKERIPAKMVRGDEATFTFEIPGAADGMVSGVLVIDGYYIALPVAEPRSSLGGI